MIVTPATSGRHPERDTRRYRPPAKTGCRVSGNAGVSRSFCVCTIGFQPVAPKAHRPVEFPLDRPEPKGTTCQPFPCCVLNAGTPGRSKSFVRPSARLSADEDPAERTQRSAPPPPGLCWPWPVGCSHGRPPHPPCGDLLPPWGGEGSDPSRRAPSGRFLPEHTPAATAARAPSPANRLNIGCPAAQEF